MASNQNGNEGGEEDDDFGDFGGFEAAEPLEMPAQAQGGQAAPNVWAAAMFSPAVAGARNVQPDLLCGPNRFPPHLDTPSTLDLAGSAQGRLPQGVELGGEDDDLFGDLTAGGLDGNQREAASGDNPLDQDGINMANDILDGSFRSASTGQPGQGLIANGPERVPDISGLDLAAGISGDRANGENGRQPTVNNSDIVNSVASANVLTGTSNVPKVPDLRRSAEPAHTRARTSPGGAEGGFELANQEQEQVQASANKNADHSLSTNQRSGARNEAEILLQRANEEKDSLQRELSERISENTRLQEDLSRAEALADTARQELQEIQGRHASQLDDLRAAGHTSLTLVVEEYKASLSACMQQQLEACQCTLTQGMKEETERLRQLLQQQKEEFDRLQEEERRKNEQKVEETVEAMKLEQRREFDKLLEEERTKYETDIQAAIQTERESCERRLAEVVKEEQEITKQALLDQQKTFEGQLTVETEKHKAGTNEALKEQQNKYKEEMSVAVREERAQCTDAMQAATQTVRDEMNTYLHQQREADRSVQRRHLASLDLFLSTARQQLDVLMDTSRDPLTNENPFNNSSRNSASHSAAGADQSKENKDSADQS